MAWTAPMTAVANTPFTAAQFNAHVRDNLLETAPAKATAAGNYFTTAGTNYIVERSPSGAIIPASQTTTSTAFTTLTTAGPTVVVETGTRALVCLYAGLVNTTSSSQSAMMGFVVTGATTLSATTNRALVASGAGGIPQRVGAQFLVDLNPGTNTFSARYRSSSGSATASFADRQLLVFPL